MFREYVLSIAQILSSSAGQVQPPRKSLHPYSNKVMSPRSPYQTKSLKEEDPQSKPILMPRVNQNAKNKFFPQPDQKTTDTSSSSLKRQARDALLPPSEHREMTVSLPQLDHPTIVKPSPPKHLNKTTILPLKCLDYKDNATFLSLAHPKQRRNFGHDPDTWAEPPTHSDKLPKVPLAPDHLCKGQQCSIHRTEALLYRSQQLRNPPYPDNQDNTRIYPEYKRRTTPVSSLCSKFETKTTNFQLPCHGHHSKASPNLAVCQKAKTSLLQCHNHQLRVQPLPCSDYSYKTKAKPLSSPNHWARDIAVPSPCPMHGYTTMVVQCTGFNNSERTRAVPIDPDNSSIPSQCNQPSSVPSSISELHLQEADYKVKETSMPLSDPEQKDISPIHSEHQIEAGQDYNPKITDQAALLPLCPDQLTKIVFDPDQCTVPLQDPNLKAESALNQEKCVEIVTQVETQMNQDCRIKSPTGSRYQIEGFMEPDQQAHPLPDIKDKVKTEMELDQQVEPQKSHCEQAKDESRPKHGGEIPPVPEQQDQTLSAQDHQLEVTSDHNQGTTTLLGPGYKTEAQLAHDHLSGAKKQAQATSPVVKHHLGKSSLDLKTQATSLPDPDLDNKPPCAELQAITTIGHAQQEKTPANSRFLTIPFQGLNHRGKVLTYNEDRSESLPSAWYHANAAVQKIESSWCFRYIKPFIIEGGTISDGIVNKIISSIPQEKIKNDMQKILLEQSKGWPIPQTGHSLSSNYNICLLCASWIPYGCSHVNEMDYHCSAQLVAIPIPIPGSKVKMGIKFVLKLPKQQASSTFCLTLPHYDMPDPSNLLLPFPPPSCSDTTPLESPIDHWKAPMATWFDYIRGKDHYLNGRQTPRSQQSFLGKISEQSNTTREEESRGSVGVFKSLLEKFQRKRRAN